MIGKLIIIMALLVVAATLVAGIAVMAMGGKADAKWSNVLMRYRILAQAAAIAIVLAVLYFSSGH
ncbi:MAG TPA: twin transmembrane helix small protein [Rhizomicrobium sp.]|nr:twin transmembrane helix small protein [Rhizomicrobium sp.]